VWKCSDGVEYHICLIVARCGGGATILLPRDGGAEEFHRDPTVGQRSRSGPEIKVAQRRRGSDAGQSKGGEVNPAVDDHRYCKIILPFYPA